MEEQLRDIKNLAFYIINIFNAKGIILNNVKLHKMLYYIYGYYYKYFNTEIFSNKFYAWAYGPVIKDLYYDMLNYESKNLKLHGDENFYVSDCNIKKLIEIIIDSCSLLTTNQIIDKVKSETPLLRTTGKSMIKEYMIKDYFNTNNPLNIPDITLINKTKKLIK